MPVTQMKFKKLNKYILIFVVSVCLSNPCFAADQCSLINGYTSNTTCVGWGSGTYVNCGACMGVDGAECDKFFKLLLLLYNTLSAMPSNGTTTISKMQVWSIMAGRSCYTVDGQPNKLSCIKQWGQHSTNSCRIDMTFDSSYNISSVSTTGCNWSPDSESQGHPYFDVNCSMQIDDDYVACSSFAATNTPPTVTLNNVAVQPDNNAIWDFNNNTWNISRCGDYYWLDHNAIHNYEHCYQGYARSRVSVTFEENKPIYKGRTTDIRLYKIKYGTTANTPEFCCDNLMCYEHYDMEWVSSAYSDNACARCVESTPDCPTGFTSQHNPWQCNVDSNITYTDSTGTFTLSNGSYDPTENPTGYLNNTICPVNNN